MSKSDWIKKVEQRLPKAATPERLVDLLRSALAHVPSFVSIVDDRGRFLLVNRVAPGLSEEALYRSTVFDFTAAAYHEGLRAALKRALETGEAQSYAARGLGAHGSEKDYDNRVTPLVVGDGAQVLLIVSSDITDQLQSARALRESRERVGMAVVASGMGLWSWNARQDRVTWDERMCEIFGIEHGAAPMDYDGYLALVHPEDRAEVRRKIGRYLESGVYEGLVHRVLVGDSTRWVLITGRVFHGADGRPERFLGGVLDITERRHMEEQLRQSQKLEAVWQLTAGIAHNFNNLLMGMLPNLEVVLSQAPGELRPALQDVVGAAERAADLVRQLLATTVRQRGGRSERFALAPAISRTVDMCRQTFERWIDLAWEPPPADVSVEGVEFQIEQVLLNILLNARDALGDDRTSPRIDVFVDQAAARHPETGLESTWARVRIRDNGIGMDDATQARIFEPFFTTKDAGFGTGLGLATCYNIVRDHGGWLACRSSPGLGTEFALYLPSPESASEVEAPGAAAPARAEVTAPVGERILLVDDEPLVSRATSRVLARAGYEVDVVASGEEALAKVDELGPGAIDLVLLDLSMPGMSGLTVAPLIRQRSPRTRIVLFTGYAVDADTNLGDAVIEKPIGMQALLERVRQILDR